MTLGELAAASAIAAAVALVLAGVAFALFVGGAGAVWGPINDVLVAITAILLIPAVVVVLRLAPDDLGPWFAVLSAVAIAGLVVIAVGQLALVAGVISLETSFLVGGIGFVPVLAWMISVAWLTLAADMLPSEIGWWLVGALVAIPALALSAAVLPWPITTAVALVLLACLVAWLLTLSGALRLAA